AKLQRVDIAGGAPQPLAPAADRGLGGTWNADGTILFSAAYGKPLLRVASSGGDAGPATRLAFPQQTRPIFPQFLPDGRHFIFLTTSNSPEIQGIYLGSLDGGEPKRLTAADTAGAYLAPDRLIFMRLGALVSRRLDIARGELTGDALTLADPVGYDAGFFFGGFFVLANCRGAYRAGGFWPRRMWFFFPPGSNVA